MENGIINHGLNSIIDEHISFAVIFSRYLDHWIISRQGCKTTWEVQGGHRDENEVIRYTAARELYEESGARVFRITPITNYSMVLDGMISYGQLYYSEVVELGDLPEGYEIEEVKLVETFPDNMTYGKMHKLLYEIIVNHNIDESTSWYNYEIHRKTEIIEV